MINEANFKCTDDCHMGGCPGHLMELDIQGVSGAAAVSIEGEHWFYSDSAKLETLFSLIKASDYWTWAKTIAEIKP